MKISQIRIRNVLGSRDIAVSPKTPFTLFCGFNGAGKSSIQEGLRLAFQGETLRVAHKKDFGLMVTDGAKEGFVKIIADDNTYEYKLPSGSHTQPDSAVPADQLNAVLNAQRFAGMTPDARREFLTVLTKSRPNKDKIRALLIEAGLDEARIDLALPMLHSGFPAACEIAKQKATEAKGAWKAVAGGNWGSIKAEGWAAPAAEAPATEDLQAAAEAVNTTEQALASLQQALGGLAEKANAQKARQGEIDRATKTAAGLDRAKDKLVRDDDALASYAKELADLQARSGTAPKDGLIHDMARFIASIQYDENGQAHADGLIGTYEAEFGKLGAEGDAEALAKIPAIEKSRDLMQRCVENGKRDVAEAEAAKKLLATLAEAEPVDEDAIAAAKEGVAEVQARLTAARADLAALRAQEKAASERDTITTKAKAHHVDVLGWSRVAEQFAPDGIPSQILAKALEPINNLLRKAATDTDWRQVAIAPDMEITAGNRRYALHSESERWMIDAMLTYAISELAGLKMLVLDRFDVLDVHHRATLIYWISDLAAAGKLDSALIFGTLKDTPKGLPDNVEAVWISSGEIEGNGLLAA